jgi:ankyrin repeat protein
VRALLDKGADLNKRTKGNNLPLLDVLYDLKREGSVETAMLLIEKGADPNAAYSNGASALLMAVQGKQIEVVRALLAKGADPNAASGRVTPLAAAVGATEITQLLINAGAKQ